MGSMLPAEAPALLRFFGAPTWCFAPSIVHGRLRSAAECSTHVDEDALRICSLLFKLAGLSGLLVIALLSHACGSDDDDGSAPGTSRSARTIGEACSGPSDCQIGLYCETKGDLSGMCTVACTSPSVCTAFHPDTGCPGWAAGITSKCYRTCFNTHHNCGVVDGVSSCVDEVSPRCPVGLCIAHTGELDFCHR
jgi:hypothetical protein